MGRGGRTDFFMMRCDEACLLEVFDKVSILHGQPGVATINGNSSENACSMCACVSMLDI